MNDDNGQQLQEQDEQQQAEASNLSPDFLKSVWDSLSAIDVSSKVQKKMNLSFLSWAWAWGVLMNEYPNSSYYFKSHGEGALMEVWCFLCVSDGKQEFTRAMWLPVMDHRNNSIESPTARNISDTRMRCLVKAMAMFGLGHYIYAGEDLPEAPAIKTVSKDQADKIYNLLKESNSNIPNFCKRLKVDSVPEMPETLFDRAVKLITDKIEAESLKEHLDSGGKE